MSLDMILFVFVNASMVLTASKPEGTGVAIHREVHQPHWTLRTDRQSNSRRNPTETGQSLPFWCPQ